jgi:CheY-like chemotaxis protein
MGIFVDIALSNAEALRAIDGAQPAVDLIISDIKRSGGESGTALVESLRNLPNAPRLIFYIWDLDPARGTPPGVFGITNRPDVLLDYVMDALERLPPTT